MSSEHQRLADAAVKLIEAIDPRFVGDLPAALEALAEAYPHVVDLTATWRLRGALRNVSRVKR